MSGIEDLNVLLRTMEPHLADSEFVFCTVAGSISDHQKVTPLATCQEQEGLTLVLPRDQADQAGLSYAGVFKQITLSVHSSLHAVGLTAAVATQLAAKGISANVIAAYYHDHVFVPIEVIDQAMQALRDLSKEAR